MPPPKTNNSYVMKHSLITALLWVTTMVVLTSCGVTNNNSFTSRSRYIEGGRIKEQPKAAEIDVDFSMRVTAQSDWQPTKSAARTEAEHKAITEYGIDIVVEPIWKFTASPVFSRKDGAPWYPCYKAELVGFAGKYRKTLTTEERILQLQDIDMETIEKYKLLTDPNFKNVYYQPEPQQPADNSVKGSVIIQGGLGAPVSAVAPVTNQQSLVVKPISQQPKPTKEIDHYKRATNAVKAGKAFFSVGTIALAIGGAMAIASMVDPEEDGWGVHFTAGWTTATAGLGFDIIGISCWAGGAKKLKTANNSDLTFNYQVAPTGVNLALKF